MATRFSPHDTATDILTLGPLRVLRDGTEIALRPAQRRVFSHLILDPGREISTNELIDRLWGDAPPPTARTALQVHISGIRKAIPDVVTTTPTGYSLDLSRVGHDRITFETLVKQARDAAEATRWDEAGDLAHEAVALWRGDPFPDLSDDTDAIPSIERLRDRLLEAGAIEAESLLARGHNDEAIAILRARIGESPLQDRLRSLLMLGLYRNGRQVDALREYQGYRRLLGETLGIEPTEELRTLEQRILVHDPGLGDSSEQPTPHNLPLRTTSFVGREGDTDALAALLSKEHVVTLTGPPGVGKTRLAVEVGRNLLDEFPGGVWFAGLTGAATARDVAATVAAVTASTEQITSLEQLAEALKDRPMLLILDNCEHVIEPVRRFVMAMATDPGACRVLASSRHPLNTPTEIVHRTEPLTSTMETAVALLADRVRTADRTFAINTGNTAVLTELCEGVGGIPLGIELVATWIPTLGLADTLRLLDRVRGEDSLDRAFAWSTRLLPEQDLDLLARIAVFNGSFTLERVASISTGDELANAGAVSRLVDASLISIDWSGESWRYRMLQPIREMAGNRLTETERHHVRDRHAASFVASSINLTPSSTASARAPTFSVVDPEMADYRAALAHLHEGREWTSVIRVAEALAGYWYARFLGWEVRSWLSDIPVEELADAERIRLLHVSGFLAWAVHDYDAADAAYSELLDIGRRSDDRRTVADALYGRGLIHQKRRFLDGSAMLEEAAHIYAGLDGCELEHGQCLLFRGLDEATRDDIVLGEQLLTEAISLLEPVGNLRQVSKGERWLAHCAWRRGDLTSAHLHADRAELLAREVDDQVALVGALLEQAHVDITDGDLVAAAAHLVDALDPIPSVDEVDLTQVLVPVARLLHATGDDDLARTVLAYIRDVYERYGWLPVDRTTWISRLSREVGPGPSIRNDLRSSVDHAIRRIASL